MSVTHQVQKPLWMLMAFGMLAAVACSYQAQACTAFPFEAGRRAAVSKPIPSTYSEAHFCRCSHMPHVEMTLQGINRFYGGDAPVATDPALPAVRPRSFGYMVILINFTVWHTLMLSPDGSARCLTTNGLIGCYCHCKRSISAITIQPKLVTESREFSVRWTR